MTLETTFVNAKQMKEIYIQQAMNWKLMVGFLDFHRPLCIIVIFEIATERESKQPKIVHAEFGSMVKLHCDADQSAGQPNYRWSRQYGHFQQGRHLNSVRRVL